MTGARPHFPLQAVVAVGAFAAVALALAGWTAAYAIGSRELRADFEAKQATLAVLKRQTERRLHGRRPAGGMPSGAVAISASTETVAASELQKAILTSLAKAGGALHSIQADATADVLGPGLRRLNAQTTFDSSTDALQRVLFDLETAIPFIFVNSLLVQPTAMPGGGAGDRLRVTLVVSSYWKGRGTADQAGDRRPARAKSR